MVTSAGAEELAVLLKSVMRQSVPYPAVAIAMLYAEEPIGLACMGMYQIR